MSAGASLTFVNFDGPSQSDSGAVRKAVRSRATAYSHRVAPRKGLKAAKYKPLPQTPTALKPVARPRPPQARRSDTQSGPSIPSSPQSDAGAMSTKRTSKDLTISSLLGYQSAALPKVIFSPLLYHKAVNLPETTKRKRSDSPSPDAQHPRPNPWIPDMSYFDASSKDPFETYPAPWLPWFGPIMDRFYARISHPTGLRVLKCSAAEMQAYIKWARAAEMTDPALFYTALLLATGAPVTNGSLHVNKALWLRGQAVKAINEALCDPVRATSNALISAVGKMALHEHVYGDREAANKVHRTAQQRMIALRGGVEVLGMPTTTMHLIGWYDAYMAAESRTPAYFADLPERLKGVKSFTREEAVLVTNAASPKRHMHPRFGEESDLDTGSRESGSSAGASSIASDPTGE